MKNREYGMSLKGSVIKNLIGIFLIAVLTGLSVSCYTQAKAEKKLSPPKSIKNFRLEDISKHADSDPATAIHLLEVYGILYGVDSAFSDTADPDVKAKLESLKEEATRGLKAAQRKAIEERRWTQAASLARSLSRLGIQVESTGEEPELVLEYAKEQLSLGNNLPAFLAAVNAHNLKPLSFDDTL